MPDFARRVALLLFVATCVAPCLSLPTAEAAGIVFRYLPGQPGLSSEVTGEGLSEGPYLDPRTMPARGAGGWGLNPPSALAFEAPASVFHGVADEDLRQVIGPQLAAEVWVRAARVDGRVVLVTNRVGEAEGFTLGLEDGRPFFEISFGGQSFRIDGAALAAEANHWIAATAARSGETLTLALYVDGHQQARSAHPATFTGVFSIPQPFYVGTEATGDAAAPTLTGSFTGHLFGVVVRDYVPRDAYLSSPVPHDGSPYFGLPAFHDYDLGVFHVPMDEQIDPSPLPLRHRFYLPFVNDNYVPQGTASRFEVTGTDTTALVYVAYYHMTRAGRAETLACVVAEIDAETGHLRRGFRLTGRLAHSHAGGIAYDRGALYVSSAGWLERYPLPAYDPGGPVFADLDPDADGTFQTGSKASFVSAFNDTLWVGDYRTASEAAPYLFGYPLAEDGRPVKGGRPAIYALPRNIQGVDMFAHGGETYVFMTRNRNSREAEVLRLRRSGLSPYVVPTPDTSITMPHGIEDLSFWPDGTLWTNSESGTDYYQRKSSGAWPIFFPFVYSVPGDALIPGLTATSREAGSPSPAGFELRSYPNPAAGPVHVALAVEAAGRLRVTVVDLLGRQVATLHEGIVPGGRHEFRWDDAVAPGLYFVVAEIDGRRAVRAVTRV